MLSILRTKRGKAVLGGITGVGIVGGSAVAAVLLTTSISGSTRVEIDREGPGPDKSFAVSIAAENGDRLICDGDNGEVEDALVLSEDGKTLSLNPVVRKPASSPDTPAPIDSCTITVSIDNTGEVPVRIAGASLSLPKGWSVSPLTGGARTFVEPGDEASASAVLTAHTDAEEGAITGSLTYEDNTDEDDTEG